MSLLVAVGACVGAETEVSPRELIDQDLETIIDDYFRCAANEGECSEEQQAVAEHADEISDYTDELSAAEPEYDYQFRAGAFADCGGGASVTCIGGPKTSCVGIDYYGCECKNKFGGTVSIGFCVDDGVGGEEGGEEEGGGPVCGDDICSAGESEDNCYQDCHVQVCTVGVCNNGLCCNEDADCANNHCIML